LAQVCALSVIEVDVSVCSDVVFVLLGDVREKGVVWRGRKGKDGLSDGKLRDDPANVVRREEGCTRGRK
jgi:hypothetical protein